MVVDFAFLQQKWGGGYTFEYNFCPRGRNLNKPIFKSAIGEWGGGGVERVKVSVYHYKLSCEVVLGAREILLSPLYPVKESLSLKLQFTS